MKAKIAALAVILTMSLMTVGFGSSANAATPSYRITASQCSTFPLPSGHAYAMNDGTVYTHSGVNSTDRYNIMKIQRIINNASGYSRVAVDGVFGYATRAGVIDFQKRLNAEGARVSTDGQYGASTWYAAWNYGWGGFQC